MACPSMTRLKKSQLRKTEQFYDHAHANIRPSGGAHPAGAGHCSKDHPVGETSILAWMDIPAIGSIVPISFVAKAEVGRWPIVSTLAKLQKTIFVDRTRKTDTGRVVTEMSDRMNEGRGVVLFAEGTSDIGSHVLPFRSALVGATQAAMKAGDATEIYIQPMCIAYTKLNGLPISRAERTKIAWVGDMGLTDNMSDILLSGTKSVSIMFGEPMLIDGTMDRKKITQQAHAQVREMLVALNRGLPLPKAHKG